MQGQIYLGHQVIVVVRGEGLTKSIAANVPKSMFKIPNLATVKQCLLNCDVTTIFPEFLVQK